MAENAPEDFLRVRFYKCFEQMRTGKAVAAILVVAVLVCWEASANAVALGSQSLPQGRMLRGAVPWFPDHLDPQLADSQDGWMAMYNTYIPLLTYRHAAGKEGSKVMPGLARGLPKLGDHGKTYTLYLRRGLTYSNGRRVKASDFKATIERLLKLNSEGSFYYDEIVGAEEFEGGAVATSRGSRLTIGPERS